MKDSCTNCSVSTMAIVAGLCYYCAMATIDSESNGVSDLELVQGMRY